MWGHSPQCGDTPHNKINEINEKHRPHYIYQDTQIRASFTSIFPVFSCSQLKAHDVGLLSQCGGCPTSRKDVTLSPTLSLKVVLYERIPLSAIHSF